jgi:hypothetical protein
MQLIISELTYWLSPEVLVVVVVVTLLVKAAATYEKDERNDCQQ